MSTYTYCDGCDGECRNTDDDSPLHYVMEKTAEKLVKKGWVFCKWDIHLCEKCINEYYNEEDEQLKIVDGYVELGKDFQEKKDD